VRRVGIIGFGELGQFLVDQILNAPEAKSTHELAFIWNRSSKILRDRLPSHLVLESLADFKTRNPDLIVEVAHPQISIDHGVSFLSSADYMAGSPTAFADLALEAKILRAANHNDGHGLYIPRGALPGLEEVLNLVGANQLAEAQITMKKHPRSLHFHAPLDPPLLETKAERVLYDGPLRELCALAPNNVNTMAVLALASQLGFDKVQATLIANPALDHHITEVLLLGPKTMGPRFSLSLVRESPAGVGAVTSKATFTSFFRSMLASQGAGDGIHFR